MASHPHLDVDDDFGGDFSENHNGRRVGKKRGFGDLGDDEDDIFGSEKGNSKLEETAPGVATGMILSLRESLQNCKETLATCQAELEDAKSEIKKWHSSFQNESFIPMGTSPEPKLAVNYLHSVRTSEESLREQLEKAKKKEAAFIVTFAKREQEIAELKSAVRDLKVQLKPPSMQARRLLLDPAIHEEFTRLKNLVEEKEKKIKELEDNAKEVVFTTQSKQGKMLMAKCRTLQLENEEIGNQASEGKILEFDRWNSQIRPIQLKNSQIRPIQLKNSQRIPKLLKLRKRRRENPRSLHRKNRRIRQAVRYTRSSPSRLLKFRQCVEDEKLSTKSLPLLDTVTRWNSTYSMLESAVKCEKAFARLEDQETSYLRDFVSNATLQNPPTSKDWDVARRYVKFLQVFYEVTMKISGSTYVTSHTYFHDYCRILNLLKTWMEQSEDFGLSHLAERMKAKHDKYWGDLSCINHIHFVGVMLDPRYKTKFISWSFAKLFGKELADMVVGNVKRTLVSLYDHYRLHDSSSGSTDSASSSNASNVDMMCDDGSTFASEFMKEMSAEESLAGKSELDRYLFESHEAMSVNFDILNWWKVNAGKYPILSQLAMDVLAVPITTVPSEAAFSNGGRILDAYRSSLLPKTVEALICTENWLRSTPVTSMVEDSIEELEKIEEAMGKLDIGGELKS